RIRFRHVTLLKHLLAVLDKSCALNHRDTSTALAIDFEIRANPNDRPFVASTGTRFPHPHPVTHKDLLHGAHLRTILKQYTSPTRKLQGTHPTKIRSLCELSVNLRRASPTALPRGRDCGILPA